MKYQTSPVPEDLIKVINKTDSFDNKIQVDHFSSYNFTAQGNCYDINVTMRIILKTRITIK